MKDDRREELAAIHAKMHGWEGLVEDAGPVSVDLAIAVGSGRPELVLVPQEPTKEQAQSAYRVVRALLATNLALQRHAAILADELGQLNEMLGGAHRKAMAAEDIANFRSPDGLDEETD